MDPVLGDLPRPVDPLDVTMPAVARPQRRPSARIDALIDAIATITLESPVTGDLARNNPASDISPKIETADSYHHHHNNNNGPADVSPPPPLIPPSIISPNPSRCSLEYVTIEYFAALMIEQLWHVITLRALQELS